MKLRLLLAVILPFSALAQSPAPISGRETLSLDPAWRFHLGDVPFPVVTGHSMTYSSAKAGRALGAAAPDFDDTDWRMLDLPHDFVVEGPFDPKANISQGYRPRGIAWYRRSFTLPPSDRGKHLEIQIDGVATHCTVWFNGMIVHRNWCGYSSFYIDITPFAKYGNAQNSIAICVDANEQEGWWYEGGGIYRHTWLVKRPPVHIVTDGVFAHPVKDAQNAWTLPVEVNLANSGREAAPAHVEVTLLDPAGKQVAQSFADTDVPPLEEALAKLTIPVQNPKLWSVDEPTLYTVRTVISHAGQAGDSVTTTCGFRTIRFDPDKGFFLNEKPLKLQGVCNHQDHAGVGVAVPDALWDFRVRRLKEMGANAYRCAHNPPAKEFLDACDRLGLLVMDENRNFNSSPEYLRQLQWMVTRDRNHPSVILWSVFNEEPMQGTEIGFEMVRRMAAEVKKLDATRPVTAAMNGGLTAPINVSQAVDVVGFNYQQGAYDNFHRANPKLPLTSSEDTSAFMMRGVYETDKKRNLIGSYDDQRAPWGATHRDAWKAIAQRPFLAGGFVWTGFDYRGEPTPLSWPTAGSVFGAMDSCGFPKAAFYVHQAQWVKDRPIVSLIPHWNWAGKEGQPIKVMVMSNAETISLLLNGHEISAQPVNKAEMNTWQAPYTAGVLEAVAKRNGVEVARSKVETTSEPASLQLVIDRPGLAGDGRDAQPVTVQALDAQGRTVPTANLPVHFELTGPGAIIGLGNGDSNSHEPEKGNDRSLYNGLAQVILQSRAGGHGELILRATSPGLQPGSATIKIAAAATPPSVAKCEPVATVEKWRQSPVAAARPDPNQEIADHDQNSWVNVQAGKLQKMENGGWVILRTKFRPFAAQRKAGGSLIFRSVAGKAEVYVDKKLVGTKTAAEPGPIVCPLSTGDGERTLSVLIEATASSPVGFGDAIVIEAAADPWHSPGF